MIGHALIRAKIAQPFIIHLEPDLPPPRIEFQSEFLDCVECPLFLVRFPRNFF